MDVTTVATLQTPYSNEREDDARLTSPFLRVVRLCVFCLRLEASSMEIFLLLANFILTFACAYFTAKQNAWILKPQLDALDKQDAKGFFDIMKFALLLNLGSAFMHVIRNFVCLRLMTRLRVKLTKRLHDVYMSPVGRLYYTMAGLDQRIENPGVRITNDVDLLLQNGFEFVLGGVMKVESGLLQGFLNVILTNYELVRALTEGKNGVGFGTWFAVGAVICGFVLFALDALPIFFLTKQLQATQTRIQEAEANFRAEHAACTLHAESIAFYGGEVSARTRVEDKFEKIYQHFAQYRRQKVVVDFMTIMFQNALNPLSYVIMGGLLLARPGTALGRKFDSIVIFHSKNLMVALKSYFHLMESYVFMTKLNASSNRTVKLVEVMEEFILSSNSSNPVNAAGVPLNIKAEQRTCCGVYYEARQLPQSEVVSPSFDAGISFKQCDVFTPDGARKLLSNFEMRMKPGERCLIQGPSGIGKSSLLRVLGGLWPLYSPPRKQIPRKDVLTPEFSRPGDRSIFFLAQRPYLVQGTLREQIAYPVWQDSVLEGLSESKCRELFEECGLHDLWEARASELDDVDVSWSDELSLGEQQRLQFCRLFWHAEWHRNAMGNEAFFAVLDESTASMDIENELLVYRACQVRGIGLLSVAHRPTVIQFHSSVLRLSLEGEDASVRYEVVDSLGVLMNEVEKISPKQAPHDGDEETRQSRSSLVAMEASVSEKKSKEFVQHQTPYARVRKETSFAGPALSVVRICFMCCKKGMRTALLVLFISGAILAAGEASKHPVMIWYQRRISFHGDITLPALATVGFVVFLAAMRAFFNFFAMQLLIEWRAGLVKQMHQRYLDPARKPYYVLNNLDSRIDLCDQRMTTDMDLMMQYFFEFFFGGIMVPHSGVMMNLLLFVANAIPTFLKVESSKPGWGLIGPALSIIYFGLVMSPCLIFMRFVSRSQADVQRSEGLLRKLHDRLTACAESVAFYRGEATEQVQLDAGADDVGSSFRRYSVWRLPGDTAQLLMAISYWSISNTFGGIVAFAVYPTKSDDEAIANDRKDTYKYAKLGFFDGLRCLSEIVKQLLDYGRATGYLASIISLAEALEGMDSIETVGAAPSLSDSLAVPSAQPVSIELTDRSAQIRQELLDNDAERRSDQGSQFQPDRKQKQATDNVPAPEWKKLGCCGLSYPVDTYLASDVLEAQVSDDIVFSKVDIISPTGRLLMENISLTLTQGERCLIQGPSGIGKSSMLRVLGNLWPLFQTPGATSRKAYFSRPDRQNIFFLAQRPYLVPGGTLREQISYPAWEPELHDELTAFECQRLFLECGLAELWEEHQHNLEASSVSGTPWNVRLSLGEQQRLQFCRLFWHAEYHNKKHNEGFFAILDESTAAMDTNVEMTVYKACKSRGLGILSVAHRPTVIQYHTKVLQFSYADNHKVKYCTRDAAEVSREARAIAGKYMEGFPG